MSYFHSLQNFDHPVLEENPVSVGSNREEVQTDSITASPITASERDDESHSDHSQPLTESQVIKRNPPRTRKPPTRLQDYVTYASRHPITEMHQFS